MKLTINRKPTCLANRSQEQYSNLWRCASDRARQASNDHAGRCYQTANALWEHAQRCRKLPFQPNMPEEIIPSEHYDQLLVDRNAHIASALSSKVLELPEYLSEMICDQEPGWADAVAEWLSINDDERTEYHSHRVIVGSGESDLSGEIDLTWFTDGKGDKFWRPFYAVVDGEIYDCRDATIGDCSILDETIGWYVTGLDGEQLPDDLRLDELAAGYSSNPTGQLEKMLKPGSTPVWHWGLNCFVARLQCWPHPVQLFPEAPHYGG
jgi:hypothetical protein